MITGTVPFRANNLKDLHRLIIRGRYKIPNYLSAEAQDLISRMIVSKPKKRLTPSEILKHPWLHGIITDSELGCQSTFSAVDAHKRKENLDINPSLVELVEEFGFRKAFVMKSIKQNNFSHAAACYSVLYRNQFSES